MLKLSFGCIADDFTGASDAASFIKKSGMKTVLVTGIPDKDLCLPEGTECVVIALKIRTIPSGEAVALALEAYEWLKGKGAEHIYYKYCSTFDSTDKGNIGPVIDAILDKYELQGTILCPALPVNGRTVKDGLLYVNGVPLNETHMRFHPLTPMLSAYIPELMSKQGKYSCRLLASTETYAVDTSCTDKTYYVPDYCVDEDAEKIAQGFYQLPFLTGGSGILTALGRLYSQEQAEAAQENSEAEPDAIAQGGERALLLAGSCSAATLGQIKCFIESGGKAIRIQPESLFAGPTAVEQLWAELENEVQASAEPLLIYSSSSPEEVKRVQELYGSEVVSGRLEGLMAKLVVKAVASGYAKLIVAGGETSGAVTEALKADAYEIGAEIAPGVPIMYPLRQNGLQLALKSGNFGKEHFFREAITLMQKGMA